MKSSSGEVPSNFTSYQDVIQIPLPSSILGGKSIEITTNIQQPNSFPSSIHDTSKGNLSRFSRRTVNKSEDVSDTEDSATAITARYAGPTVAELLANDVTQKDVEKTETQPISPESDASDHLLPGKLFHASVHIPQVHSNKPGEKKDRYLFPFYMRIMLVLNTVFSPIFFFGFFCLDLQ